MSQVETWYRVGTRLQTFTHVDDFENTSYSVCIPRFATPKEANNAFDFVMQVKSRRGMFGYAYGIVIEGQCAISIDAALNNMGALGERVRSLAKETCLTIKVIRANEVTESGDRVDKWHTDNEYKSDARKLLVYVDPKGFGTETASGSCGYFEKGEYHDENEGLRDVKKCGSIEAGDAFFFDPTTCHRAEGLATGRKMLTFELFHAPPEFEVQIAKAKRFPQAS